MIDPHIAPVGSETLNRQQIHVELRQQRERFHAILDSSTAGELRQPSNGTRWYNEELLFHMLFGYIVVVVLIRIIKTLGLLPRSTTKPFALLLNASTRPFNAINYWPPGPGGHRRQTYTLFEGTSEIQRLVVARAVSGMHIP